MKLSAETGTLSPELSEWAISIADIAKDLGLDFYPVAFEVLPYSYLNEVASYDGFATRYPHWRFGMQYQRLSKTYSYGLSKIYELVINNNPCIAYLMEGNSDVAQKLVMAHVYAHCDFFKNNMWFSHTTRKAIDALANHGTRIRRYIGKYGLEKVEQFIDACLSIENLIDIFSVFEAQKRRPTAKVLRDEEVVTSVPLLGRAEELKPYMQQYINPPEFVERQKKKLEEKIKRQAMFPEKPERDVLLFLLEHAPLQPWQHDILAIIRDEAYYFMPQRLTKIMNEGWATYWHSKMMTEHIAGASEIIEYADLCAGTLATGRGQLNPYKLGVELYRDVEERWNKGQFGKLYDECDNRAEKAAWDKGLGLGRKKIFEVRKLYNDITFIDEFLTPEFAARHKMFTFEYNPNMGEYQIASREFGDIKNQLLFELTNFGSPIIEVYNANYKNRGELYLIHDHQGVDLQFDYAAATLENLYKVWTRPVHVQSLVLERPFLLSYDGSSHKKGELTESEYVQIKKARK
ncbi:MAG: SpoVR family protein [Planctomycetes bacterium]|nr:SpoVR family protein [Planctomycetota bacterium]